jgi:M6 family metalloprotease-like protein
MKKSNFLRSICFLASIVGSLGIATAAPYEPEGREITWGQGPPLAPTMQLRLRVFGDEYYGRTETLAGYTVVYVYQDNSYYYAKLSDDGLSLVSTGVLANLAPPAGLGQRIDLGTSDITQAASSQRLIYDAERKARWDTRVAASQIVRAAAAGSSFQPAVLSAARENSKAVTGSIVGLTILAQFAGDPAPAFDQTKIRSMFNQGTPGAPGIPALAGTYTQDGNVGSVNNYFSEQSAGRLNFVQLVTPIVTLPGSRASYNFEDTPTNNEVRSNARAVAEDILRAAISALEATGFNFAPLSVDSTGKVLVTNIILSSPDSGAHMQGIWPHAGSVANPSTNPVTFGTASRPRQIKEYALRTVGTAPITIGTLCHEDAQMLLGFPDLYAYPNMGVGNYCLMGTGSNGSVGSAAVPATAATNGTATTPFVTAFPGPGLPAIPVSSANGGRRPAPINPHFKNLVGWNTVTEITSSTTETATLPTATATSGVARRFRKPGSATESFIVENRSTASKWIAAPLDTGVAIWHVDDSRNGNIQQSSSDVNGVSLEQADGLSNLENSILGSNSNASDAGDLFKLTRPSFSATTKPSSAWIDGTASGFQTRVVSVNGTISSDVAFGPFVPVNTILIDSPNGGEFAFWQNVFPITWSANITGNVRIELCKAGTPVLLIANNVVTSTRRFNWTVPKTVKPGADYTIRITSMTNQPTTVPAPAVDNSDNPFTIFDVAFPRNQSIPYGWVKPSGSVSSWVVSNLDAVDGSFSLAAIKPRDGSNAGIEYTSTFVEGTVSFYIKVSTEAGYDFARFYIDDVEQNMDGTQGLSGSKDWQQYSFPVAAGRHTFKWTYQKDDSFGGLNDRVFLDAVILPATTEEIAVETLGANIESGASTTTFPDTTIGSTSAAQTFTIRNTGTSDLYAISLQTEGTNLADFVVSTLPKTFLLAGTSMTFNVTFKPTVAGAKVATLNIISSDASESTFSVALQGNALGLPLISVSEPTGTTAMRDGRETRSFGSAPVGSIGATRTFTITNRGEGQLTGLAVTKSGKANADFQIGALSGVSVPPAGTATFTVTFSPTALKGRSAAIRIASNDVKSGPFDFKVSGTGTAAVPTITSSSSSSFSISSRSLEGAPSVIGFAPTTLVIGGLKYNSLSIPKGTGTVEVSSNLIDWFSGSDYTTVVSDDGTTLTVRDKTPDTEAAKRYIRRK